MNNEIKLIIHQGIAKLIDQEARFLGLSNDDELLGFKVGFLKQNGSRIPANALFRVMGKFRKESVYRWYEELLGGLSDQDHLKDPSV